MARHHMLTRLLRELRLVIYFAALIASFYTLVGPPRGRRCSATCPSCQDQGNFTRPANGSGDPSNSALCSQSTCQTCPPRNETDKDENNDSQQTAIEKDKKERFKRELEKKCELDYWNRMHKNDNYTFKNKIYEQYYTKYLGFKKEFYQGKKILDIGCGPRGSLEWANSAGARICVDPLADEYVKMSRNEHMMVYITAGVELLPFPNGHFDITSSFSSFDHVEDYKKGIAEIGRVLKSGGLFLVIVEIHYETRECEPNAFPWSLLRDDFVLRGFKVVGETHHEDGGEGCAEHAGTMRAAAKCPRFNHSDPTPRNGWLKAVLQKL